LDRSIATITPDDVAERHAAIAMEVAAGGRHSGQVTANLTMKTLRCLFNYAAEKNPNLGPNPVRRLRRAWYFEERRTRTVESHELPRFYAAVDALENSTARDFIKTLLFSGMRRTECASLEWTDIDLVAKVIHIRAVRAKSKRALDVPMSDVLFNIFVARRTIGTECFVFASHGKSGYLSQPRFFFGQIALATGISVSCHDLRRCFVTCARRAGVDWTDVKRLVNHSVGTDVTSGYDQTNTEDLRIAAQKVADKLKALCEIKPITGENVLTLR
jgi:integrase